MKVEINTKGSRVNHITFQESFPKNTKCCRCKGNSRLAFVAHEMEEVGKDGYITNLYNNGNKLWLHDACCVAIYFCEDCLEPTALYNQA